MPASLRRSPTGCPVGDVLRLLGRPHVLAILHSFDQGSSRQRFIVLQRRLQISPNTLSERLRDLVDAGLLTRTSYNEIPPRVDYALTAKARDLMGIFVEITAWAQRFDLSPAPGREARPVSARPVLA